MAGEGLTRGGNGGERPSIRLRWWGAVNTMIGLRRWVNQTRPPREERSRSFLNTLQMRVYKARMYLEVLARDRWRRLRISLIGLLESWTDLGIGTVR